MFQSPEKVNMGSPCQGVISACIMRKKDLEEDSEMILKADRYAMGAPLPEWQREACWTRDQQIRLIESIWIGLPIGFYVINREKVSHQGVPHKFSGILIDGQQRMLAVEAYLNNEFPVCGAYWKDTPLPKKREFRSAHFPYYEVSIWKESQLRELYNRLNFGGVAHREDQKA